MKAPRVSLPGPFGSRTGTASSRKLQNISKLQKCRGTAKLFWLILLKFLNIRFYNKLIVLSNDRPSISISEIIRFRCVLERLKKYFSHISINTGMCSIITTRINPGYVFLCTGPMLIFRHNTWTTKPSNNQPHILQAQHYFHRHNQTHKIRERFHLCCWTAYTLQAPIVILQHLTGNLLCRLAKRRFHKKHQM